MSVAVPPSLSYIRGPLPNSYVIKQNESELSNTDFEIQIIKGETFPLFSIVLQNLQLIVSLELTNQFSWGFSAKCGIKYAIYNHIEN